MRMTTLWQIVRDLKYFTTIVMSFNVTVTSVSCVRMVIMKMSQCWFLRSEILSRFFHQIKVIYFFFPFSNTERKNKCCSWTEESLSEFGVFQLTFNVIPADALLTSAGFQSVWSQSVFALTGSHSQLILFQLSCPSSPLQSAHASHATGPDDNGTR